MVRIKLILCLVPIGCLAEYVVTHLPIFTIGKMKEGSLNLLLIHIHLCIIVRNWNARIFFIVPKQAGMYVG